MSNEPNMPIPAQELTEKELKGIVGGTDSMSGQGETKSPMTRTVGTQAVK